MCEFSVVCFLFFSNRFLLLHFKTLSVPQRFQASCVFRAKASALLMRQHFLEELMQDNDLAVAVPQPPAEYQTPDGRNERNGYYMSSPSYY